MPTKTLEKFLLHRLKNPAFAGTFIKEYCTRSKEDSDELHQELVFSALEALGRAHGICIIHVKD
jgi:hypothetical protein